MKPNRGYKFKEGAPATAEAGRKGGSARGPKKSENGRKGGIASGQARRAKVRARS